ncbi:transketolase [Formicincola oecophyllae]|uniref:Transketolase n=2 Tax=Formicincola oecophyllae TaxID=2558361 RepID=A0A4Y6UCX3_9PROT|nr:transketolase [Formicincola oecophyllae]QDH14428.1 transketolase [Formicincola oecophyllae]
MATAMDNLVVSSLRSLCMDAVEQAGHGHPGTPLGMAPALYAFWRYYFTYDPHAPWWADRDRFVLSSGHASILLYAMLHLAGVEGGITLDDLKNFRRMGAKTPGHPEYGLTAGIEVTTGPLGQGCTTSVGMAMAARWLGARYNKPGFELFTHHVTAFCGDGDMMEGMAAEAASLAGHQELGNLTWLYDSNHISIEGSTDITFTEDVAERFRSYGWHVVEVAEGNDVAAIAQALGQARAERGRPSLVVVTTTIGHGAPGKAGTAAAHGAPLGVGAVAGAKAAMNWPGEAGPFHVPEGVKEHVAATSGARGTKRRQAWEGLLARYKQTWPELGAELETLLAGQLPDGWDNHLPRKEAGQPGAEPETARASSGHVLNAVAGQVPWLVGGAADVSPSTCTEMLGAAAMQAVTPAGRNIHFGVREAAMAAVCNGMALSGLRPFCSCFLVFSDYMKAPLRLSAMMGQPALYLFTHDSVAIGADGPTHQPVEQLAQLRALPGLVVIRPADANEVSEAWRVAMKRTDGPTALVLARQKLPLLDRKRLAPASMLGLGGYVLASSGAGLPDVILIATGSEVALALAVFQRLEHEGVSARVVAMPSWELFEAQDKRYRQSVLPSMVKARVVVEMASPFGWERYAGEEGDIVGIDGFGEAGTAEQLKERYGFTEERIYGLARCQMARHPRPGVAAPPSPHGAGAKGGKRFSGCPVLH